MGQPLSCFQPKVGTSAHRYQRDSQDEDDEIIIGRETAASDVKNAEKEKENERSTPDEIEATNIAQDLKSFHDPDQNPTTVTSPTGSSIAYLYEQTVSGNQQEIECVMCLDTFDVDNPRVRTLCQCGVNRTNFHLSCLYEWIAKHSTCPVCRKYLFFEET